MDKEICLDEHSCRGRHDLDALLLDLESAAIAYRDAPMDYARRKHADTFRALATAVQGSAWEIPGNYRKFRANRR